MIIFLHDYIIMDKLYIFAIAIAVLILVGYFYSRMTPKTTTTTTTKKVVVTKPVYLAPQYGYRPPPPHYNPYKAQYY
jgi:hypothetical protein